MNKYYVALIVGIASFALMFSGCGGSGSSPANTLDGNWTLSTSQPGGAAVGNGTITLQYQGTFTFFVEFESYSGSGTVGGTSYIVGASYLPSSNDVTVTLTKSSDSEDDEIDFSGTLDGNTVTGTYSGSGTYAGRTGNFTMSR